MNTTARCVLFANPQPNAFSPLQIIRFSATFSGTVRVLDGDGRCYATLAVAPTTLSEFTLSGALGTHRIESPDGTLLASFTVDAKTALHDDTGAYSELFDILWKTLRYYSPTGTSSVTWRGKEYAHYVHWILDHSHTAKGMQYFADGARGIVELLSETQREDGLIWSWIFPRHECDHFLSAYGPDDYAREIGDQLVVGRQPLENHPEYNFVDAMHTAWKSSGDLEWLRRYVDHAIRALNYTLSQPFRYSPKFQLLVRAFTIDSWDFQATDEYFIPCGIGANQRIVPGQTKMGVFFGDNHGYADACDKLAEMLRALQRTDEAESFTARGAGIRQRLTDLVWNGSFFRQREEEDPTVHRDFGVDLDQQVAMSNLYALNRGITQDQKDAIIAWYQDLRAHLPRESPGEWYSIYPPFEKPFSGDCDKWDYMNAGVHGHAAGELVRGAFKCGHEDYASDVLTRLLDIGRRTPGRIIAFAYTGSHELPPPPPVYTPVDLSAVANMDILIGEPGSQGVDWTLSKKPFDLINLPSGDLTVSGAPYHILDRARTQGRVAAAVGPSPKLPESLTIPIHAKAAAIRLAHCCADHREDPMAALLTFRYTDGSEAKTGLYQPQHVDNWWYVHAPETPTGGVFWRGPDSGAIAMGLVWTELKNPHPEREIDSLVFTRSFDGTIYALVALTLASAPVFIPKTFASYGGPDNWSGGLIMAGLQEGLIGAENAPGSSGFQSLVLSPRWAATPVSTVTSTTRFATGTGYVTYTLRMDRKAHTIEGSIATSATHKTLRLLLPAGTHSPTLHLKVNGIDTPVALETIRESLYATATLPESPSALHFRLSW